MISKEFMLLSNRYRNLKRKAKIYKKQINGLQKSLYEARQINNNLLISNGHLRVAVHKLQSSGLKTIPPKER